jgi:hypothetical protein
LDVATASDVLSARVVDPPPRPGDDIERDSVVGAKDKLGFDIPPPSPAAAGTTVLTPLAPVATGATKYPTGRARLPLGPSTTTGGPPVAANRLFGVTRAVNAGVADEVATLGVCLSAAADGDSRGATAAAAATTTALTAPAMNFLRLWVVFTIAPWVCSRPPMGRVCRWEKRIRVLRTLF